MTGNTQPGKLVEIGLGQAFSYNYQKDKYILNTSRLSEENTYISVFGPNNYMALESFLNDSRIKSIYQAKKAVNRREGHGEYPRNTLFVWEYSPGEALKNEQSGSN